MCTHPLDRWNVRLTFSPMFKCRPLSHSFGQNHSSNLDSDHEFSQTIFREFVFLFCCPVSPFIRTEAIFYSFKIRLNLLVCATSPVSLRVGIRSSVRPALPLCVLLQKFYYLFIVLEVDNASIFFVKNFNLTLFLLVWILSRTWKVTQDKVYDVEYAKRMFMWIAPPKCPNAKPNRNYCDDKRVHRKLWAEALIRMKVSILFSVFQFPIAILYILHILCVWFYVLSKWVVCWATQHNNKREIFLKHEINSLHTNWLTWSKTVLTYRLNPTASWDDMLAFEANEKNHTKTFEKLKNLFRGEDREIENREKSKLLSFMCMSTLNKPNQNTRKQFSNQNQTK